LLGKRVRVEKDLGDGEYICEGMEGVVTADLIDRLAIYFDEEISCGQKWVTFEDPQCIRNELMVIG
jgi:hypothetical protein